MEFDFSHLYKTAIVEVTHPDGSPAFSATIREITQGEKTEAQMSLMSTVDVPMEGSKKSREKIFKQRVKDTDKGGVAALVSLKLEVAAIADWTLTDAKGKPVPVCLEAWRKLPAFYAAQLEPVIERLNPEMDDEFQDESRGDSET